MCCALAGPACVARALVAWPGSLTHTMAHPHSAASPQVHKSDTLEGSDWGWAVVLWLLLLAIRGAMVVAFWPILRRGRSRTHLHWRLHRCLH